MTPWWLAWERERERETSAPAVTCHVSRFTHSVRIIRPLVRNGYLEVPVFVRTHDTYLQPPSQSNPRSNYLLSAASRFFKQYSKVQSPLARKGPSPQSEMNTTTSPLTDASLFLNWSEFFTKIHVECFLVIQVLIPPPPPEFSSHMKKPQLASEIVNKNILLYMTRKLFLFHFSSLEPLFCFIKMCELKIIKSITDFPSFTVL